MQKITKTKRKKKALLLNVLLGVFITAFLVFGGWLGYELYMDWQSQSYYTALSASIETRPRVPGQPRPSVPAARPDNTGEEAEVNGADELEEHEEDDWLPYVDFEALDEVYPGIVGWIKLYNSALDYPIMQTTNNHYFLGHLPDGTRHRSGSVFLDYRNSPDFSDKNSLLYGHESRTEDMFGALKNYRRQSFYEENPVMYIHTPEADFELVVFAAYLVDSGIESPTINFRDDEHFLEYIDRVRRRSFFQSDVVITAEDRIVSLCTCAYDYTNARFIVVGKLVEF